MVGRNTKLMGGLMNELISGLGRLKDLWTDRLFDGLMDNFMNEMRVDL